MLGKFLIIGLLTVINAFFASAEMAMISVNKNRIMVMADEGHQKAALLLRLLDEPSKFLATIQVGITLAGFFSSALAAMGLSGGLAKTLGGMNIPYSEQIALVLITVALSFVMLLFGELIPKRLALQKAEPIAMFSVKPIYYVSKIAKPFVKLLSVCTNALIRLAGIDQTDLDQKVSEEEIRSMVKVGQELGVINQTEKQMINSIFEFDDKLAREVMTPRIDVMMVDLEQSIENVMDQLVQLQHSRIPVYEGDKDNILGIVHIKPLLLSAKQNGFGNVEIKEIMIEPYYVAETMTIDRLFIKLQRERQHMALLIDEHGLVTGIVTMEDLIEEVMGEIEDEFDVKREDITYLGKGKYRVDGGLPLFDFNEMFHTTLSCVNADTIGGYVVFELGELPEDEIAQSLLREGLKIEVETIEDRRVKSLIIIRIKEPLNL